MSLKAKLEEDLKSALRGRDAFRTSLLRFVLAQIHNREIEKRSAGGGAELSEEEAREVLGREVKKRREAVALFRKGNREDLAVKDEREIAMIAAYLPPELSREEIAQVVDAVVARGAADFGSAMREAMKELGGKADGRTVQEIVKEKLAP